MKRSILTLALAGLVGLGLTVRAEDAKPAPKTVTETTVVKVTVLDVNAAKHEVAVKDQAGDVVSLTLAETLSVGLAKPGETDSVAASKTMSGGAGYVTKVVTITGLDMAVPSVTFKTADGHSQTVKIRNAKNAEGYKVGDKVALTYTGSLQLAVEKK